MSRGTALALYVAASAASAFLWLLGGIINGWAP